MARLIDLRRCHRNSEADCQNDTLRDEARRIAAIREAAGVASPHAVKAATLIMGRECQLSCKKDSFWVRKSLNVL
jgi:hypothetical protein